MAVHTIVMGFSCSGCHQEFSSQRGLSHHLSRNDNCRSFHYLRDKGPPEVQIQFRPSDILRQRDPQSTVQPHHRLSYEGLPAASGESDGDEPFAFDDDYMAAFHHPTQVNPEMYDPRYELGHDHGDNSYSSHGSRRSSASSSEDDPSLGNESELAVVIEQAELLGLEDVAHLDFIPNTGIADDSTIDYPSDEDEEEEGDDQSLKESVRTKSSADMREEEYHDASSSLFFSDSHGNCFFHNSEGYPVPLGVSLPISVESARHHFRVHTARDYYYVDLLDLLDSFGAPHYAFQSMLDWADAAAGAGILGCDIRQHPKRETFLKALREIYGIDKVGYQYITLETKSNSQFITSHPRSKKKSHKGRDQEESELDPSDFRSNSRRDVVLVPYFYFREQLQDLLDDIDIWGKKSNLTVNSQDPFAPYVLAIGEILGEIVTGRRYQEMVDYYEPDPSKGTFLLPIILYLDKTGTDIMQRYGLEPVLFTVAIIRLLLRNRSRAWRPLGFVPDLEQKDSARKARNHSGSAAAKGTSLRNYHRCLDVILQSVHQAQAGDKLGGVPVLLRIGDEVRWMRAYTPVIFVAQDGKCGDAICVRKSCRSGDDNRLSRGCNVLVRDSDDPEHQCTFMDMSEVSHNMELALGLGSGSSQERRVAQEWLEENTFHRCYSAFFHLNYGPCTGGIFSSSPTDLMHALRKGLFEYCAAGVFNQMTPTYLAHVNDLVDHFLLPLRQSERENLPRLNFTKGITNLSLITANEQVGVVFSLLMVLLSEEGTEIFDGAPRSNKQLKKRTTGPATDESVEAYVEEGVDDEFDRKDIISLLELLLAFDAWCCFGPFWEASRTSPPQKYVFAVQKLAETIKAILPNAGNNAMGWKLAKFHEIVCHLLQEMVQFGVPANFRTDLRERDLKYIKRHSRTSQQHNPVDFLKQISVRINDQLTISRAQRSMNMETRMENIGSNSRFSRRARKRMTNRDMDEPIEAPNLPPPLQRLRGVNQYRGEDGKVNKLHCPRLVVLAKWKKGSRTLGRRPRILSKVEYVGVDNVSATFPPYYERWICDTVLDEAGPIQGDCEFPVFTELDREGTKFRAHPDYRSGGQWFDWAMVIYDEPAVHVDVAPGSRRPAKRKKAEADPHKGLFHPNSVPAKILGFIAIGQRQLAIIHPCDQLLSYQNSVLTQSWRLHYKRTTLRDRSGKSLGNKMRPALDIVDVGCIYDRVLVVEECPGLHEELPQPPSLDEKKTSGKKKETGHMVRLVIHRRQHWGSQFV